MEFARRTKNINWDIACLNLRKYFEKKRSSKSSTRFTIFKIIVINAEVWRPYEIYEKKNIISMRKEKSMKIK